MGVLADALQAARQGELICRRVSLNSPLSSSVSGLSFIEMSVSASRLAIRNTPTANTQAAGALPMRFSMAIPTTCETTDTHADE